MERGAVLIKEATKAGVVFLLQGEEVRIRYPCDISPRVLEELKAHREEVRRALHPKPSPPLLAWVVTDENLKAAVPGPPERQDFRRRVIEVAGMCWHDCPVTIRETILSRHLRARDHLSAATEIMRFMGRGS